MKAAVFSVEGKKKGEISLPEEFQAGIDTGLIKRAVLSMQSAAVQPKGNSRKAGRDNTAVYRGSRNLPQRERSINVGRARLPRTKNRRALIYGRVAAVPQAVGGPKAHPPKREKKTREKINKRERKAALKSAIAACARIGLVEKRHAVSESLQLPVVFEDRIEQLHKTGEVVKALEAAGMGADLENTKSKARKRAGKGKRRGRKKKQKKSILIITQKNSPVFRAARNLPGVDVSSVRNLNAELLAPGAVPGRLTAWSEGAIKALGEKRKPGKAGKEKKKQGKRAKGERK